MGSYQSSFISEPKRSVSEKSELRLRLDNYAYPNKKESRYSGEHEKRRKNKDCDIRVFTIFDELKQSTILVV
jgi:hypothetical protein